MKSQGFCRQSTRCTQLVLPAADWCLRRDHILGRSVGARFHVAYPPLNTLLHAGDGCLPWQPFLYAKSEMGRELPAPQFSVDVAECLTIQLLSLLPVKNFRVFKNSFTQREAHYVVMAAELKYFTY